MKRKNSKKKIIIAGVLVIVLLSVAGGCFFILRPRRGMAMAKGAAEALSAEAASGSISTTVVGTGTLQNGDAEEVQIPEGLTMDEVLVESGDTVAEGDVLARVNAASILKELSEAQEELEELDEEINDAKDDTESAYVKTYIAGRVKKIYAKTGKNVVSVMEKKGALLVLSIDDKMAVSLEDVSGVSVGDEVTVTLSDGTEEEGTVESVSDSSCVITLTDDGPEMGEKVTVTDADGKELGSGKLYVHQPIEITGTSGTVADVKVEENEEVSASETLLELENLPASAEYQQLLAQRSDLTERLKLLTQLAADNTIRAEYDGIVESVNVTAEGSSKGSGASGNSAASSGTSGSSMASAAAGNLIQTAVSAAGNTDASGKNVFTYASTAEQTEEKKVTSITDIQEIVTKLSSNAAAPVTGSSPASEIEETVQYTGKITWTPADGEFAAKTSYTAAIELTAKEGYQFVLTDAAELSYPGAAAVSWEIQEQCEQNTLKLTVVFPETGEKETEQPSESETQQPSESEAQTQPDTQGDQNVPQTPDTQGTSQTGDGQKSDNISGTQDGNGSTGDGKKGSSGQTGTNGNGTAQGGNGQTGSAQNGSGGQTGTVQSGASGGSLSGTAVSSTGSQSSSSAATTTGDSSGETADAGMETAFTISKSENMLLSVNIDELDILSVQEGQKATVTLDALEGQEFEGELSKINRTASNNGGVTKYTAEVTIPKNESMLAGMNASATIIIESKENILTLPAEAVQERGNRSFVYTEEGEDGTLSGEVEIETGISDGTKVEITSGLEEGQTVYYQAAVSEEDSEEGFGGMMMDGGMMNGGERPDGGGGRGGDMPSGGAPDGGFGGGGKGPGGQ